MRLLVPLALPLVFLELAYADQVVGDRPIDSCLERAQQKFVWSMSGDVAIVPLLHALGRARCTLYVIPKRLQRRRVKLEVSPGSNPAEVQRDVEQALALGGFGLRADRVYSDESDGFGLNRSYPATVIVELPTSAEMDAAMRCQAGHCDIEPVFFRRVVDGQVGLLPDSLVGEDLSGVRIEGIPAGSLFARLGFENGDELVSVDGVPHVWRGWWRQLGKRLIKAEHLHLTIKRGGQPVELDYSIK